MQSEIEIRVHCENWHRSEEADESVLWLELIEETGVLKPKQLEAISKEARELAAIFSASQKTSKDKI